MFLHTENVKCRKHSCTWDVGYILRTLRCSKYPCTWDVRRECSCILRHYRCRKHFCVVTEALISAHWEHWSVGNVPAHWEHWDVENLPVLRCRKFTENTTWSLRNFPAHWKCVVHIWGTIQAHLQFFSCTSHGEMRIYPHFHIPNPSTFALCIIYFLHYYGQNYIYLHLQWYFPTHSKEVFESLCDELNQLKWKLL